MIGIRNTDEGSVLAKDLEAVTMNIYLEPRSWFSSKKTLGEITDARENTKKPRTF